MINPDEDKYKLYEEHTSQSDKLILLRDFNTQVRTDHQTWPRNSWKPWNLKVWYQCATPPKAVRLTRSSLSQHHVLSTNPQKKFVDAPTFQALASDRRCYRQSKRQTGRAAQTVGRTTASLFSNGTSSKKWPHGQKLKKLNVTKLKNQMTAWISPLVMHEQ